MNRHVPGRSLVVLALGSLLLAYGVAGCARVKPYQREQLSDPIMVADADAGEMSRDLKWLEAREGSTGGTGGAGGGCACK